MKKLLTFCHLKKETIISYEPVAMINGQIYLFIFYPSNLWSLKYIFNAFLMVLRGQD